MEISAFILFFVLFTIIRMHAFKFEFIKFQNIYILYLCTEIANDENFKPKGGTGGKGAL